MNQLLAVVFAAALAAGCTTGPGTSPGLAVSPAADAALEELCGENEASLGSIAAQLGQVDETTDVTALSTSIGTAMSNLQEMTLDTAAQPARDAAVTALQQVQAGLADPATLAQTASDAAAAIRTLDIELCA